MVIIIKSDACSTDFYSILAQYVHDSLVQKEDNGLLNQWMYEEAISSKNLQSGGSFMAVVLRRLQSETTCILSSIIPAIDTNCNLDLLDLANSSDDSEVVRFWLDTIKHTCISDALLLFAVSATGIFASCQNTFHCQFPFSVIFQCEVETCDGKCSLFNNKI